MKYWRARRKLREVRRLIKAIKDYIKTCPLIKGNAINVNYLGDKPIRYTVDCVPCNPVIKRYIDGGTQRQCIVVFGSKEYYGEDVFNQTAVAKFYDEFSLWIEENNKNKVFPDFGEKVTPGNVVVTSGGYLYDVSGQSARYQMQIKFIYYKD